jgi:hypothetical protein
MPEPEYVSLDRRPTAVSIICELVSKSEETTPDWLWNVLKAITDLVDDLPNDQSYRSAAQHLSRLIKERKELYDRLNRLEEGRR